MRLRQKVSLRAALNTSLHAMSIRYRFHLKSMEQAKLKSCVWVDREQVDQFHKSALDAGGTCNGKPGLRTHYHPNYYAAFVLDPCGNNIEVVVHQPQVPGADGE